MRKVPLIFSTIIICLLCYCSAVDAQIVSSRLVAEADSLSQYPDSVYYLYSAGRGGDLSHTMNFDEAYAGMQDFGMDSQFTITRKIYDLKNNVITTTQKMAFSTPTIHGRLAFTNFEKDSNVYNANGNIIMYYAWTRDLTNYTKWSLQDSIYYWYDSHNNLILSVYPGNEKDTFIYDGANNMIQNISQSWDLATSSWVNFTNTINNYSGSLLQSSYQQGWFYTGTSWTDETATLYYYNSGGDLIKKVTMQQDPYAPTAPLVNNVTDSNIYNGGHDLLLSYHLSYYPASNRWALQRDSNLYDSRHNRLLNFQQIYDTAGSDFITFQVTTNRYNTFNQITLRNVSQTVTPFDSYTNRYYYEKYMTTDIAVFNASHGTVSVYPNPASSMVNIKLQWTIPQAFTIAIYNMQGRLIQQWGEQKTDVYEKQIPVSMLSAGNYVIKVRGEQGQLQQQLSIVH